MSSPAAGAAHGSLPASYRFQSFHEIRCCVAGFPERQGFLGEPDSGQVTEGEPEEFGVQGNDGRGDNPRDGGDPAAVHELSHFRFFTREAHKRYDGEGQLEAEHDLTEDEQGGDLAFAPEANDDGGGQDCGEAREETAQPGARRRSRKPSMTICPASVPVKVEF